MAEPEFAGQGTQGDAGLSGRGGAGHGDPPLVVSSGMEGDCSKIENSCAVIGNTVSFRQGLAGSKKHDIKEVA